MSLVLVMQQQFHEYCEKIVASVFVLIFGPLFQVFLVFLCQKLFSLVTSVALENGICDNFWLMVCLTMSYKIPKSLVWFANNCLI